MRRVTAVVAVCFVAAGCGANGGSQSSSEPDRVVPATPRPEDCADDSLADELAEFCAGVIAGQMEAGGLEGGEEALESEAEANASEAVPPPVAPEVAEVGETVQFDGGVTVGSITLNGVRRITEPETEYSSATPAHGSWLVADVTVQVDERREPGALLVSAYDFTAQDESGIVYPADSNPLENTLSTEVVAGRQVRGEVAFDAPEGPLLIDWSPGFDGPTATFSVGG
jgi:hypothetical protein